MSKAHRVKTRKPKALTESFVPLHFLLGCSDHSLGEFELARLAEVADLRRELHAILDRLIDGMAQAGIAAWFRTVDRNDIRRALETPDDAMDEIILRAQEEIRTKGRSKEEQEADLIPRASLPPGAAHLAAAL